MKIPSNTCATASGVIMHSTEILDREERHNREKWTLEEIMAKTPQFDKTN